MREILYRGKGDTRFNSGGWFYGVPIKDFEGDWQLCTDCTKTTVLPETIGQYTGLTDKNGKKIFEGDIVAYYTSTNRATNKEFHEVVFETRGESGYFGIKISNIETWGFCMEVPAKLMEIIGNIHDNPELLEVNQ